MPVVRSAQIVHLSCSEINTLETDHNELPLDPHHLEVPSNAYKMIYEPMVHSVHTVHISCIEISTIFKRTNTSFYLTHVT
jgi:hypothetical protein